MILLFTCLIGIFVFLLWTTLSLFKRNHTIYGALLSAFILSLILFIGYRLDYYHPRHSIEVGLSINLTETGRKSSAIFTLPKGRYLIVAAVKQGGYENGEDAILKYHLELPQENLKFDHERKMDFGLALSQIRIQSFEIKKNASEGTISAEIVKLGSGNIILKIVTDRIFDM